MALHCCPRRLTSSAAAVMLVFERRHALGSSSPEFITGMTAAQPVLPVPGEVFALRKLLPQTADYDFNIHVMDFQPGEYLYVKVGSAATCCRGVLSHCHCICRASAGAAYEQGGHPIVFRSEQRACICRRCTTTSTGCCCCKGRASIASPTAGVSLA